MEDVQEKELESIYNETVLVVSKVTEPSDILWKNMTGVRGLFIFRRIVLTIVCILIILFISSPAAIFANVKRMDKNRYLDFDWVSNLSIGNFLKTHLPPFLIICIN